jgi:hypothetical protein
LVSRLLHHRDGFQTVVVSVDGRPDEGFRLRTFASGTRWFHRQTISSRHRWRWFLASRRYTPFRARWTTAFTAFDRVDVRAGFPVSLLALVVMPGEMVGERRSDPQVA